VRSVVRSLRRSQRVGHLFCRNETFTFADLRRLKVLHRGDFRRKEVGRQRYCESIKLEDIRRGYGYIELKPNIYK
jgi:hypothetical protein